MLLLLFFALSLLLTFFLWFIYIKQYRFVTLLCDMVPFYPIITTLGFIASVGSATYLSLTFSEMYYFLPFLVINYVLQFSFFSKWFLSYRLSKYSDFLQQINCSSDIRVIRISDWLSNPQKDPDHILVLIRHDVDCNLHRTLKMVNEEKKFNIPACYYFRNKAEKYTFDHALNLIKKLAVDNLFEVGFHYELVDNAGANAKKTADAFVKEVENFRKFYPIRMISAHGNAIVPDVTKKLISPNFSLVTKKIVDLDSLDLVSSYNIPHDYYLSDAMGLHNFKKSYYFNPQYMDSCFLNTLKMLNLLPKGSLVQILIHPDWWF